MIYILSLKHIKINIFYDLKVFKLHKEFLANYKTF